MKMDKHDLTDKHIDRQQSADLEEVRMRSAKIKKEAASSGKKEAERDFKREHMKEE